MLPIPPENSDKFTCKAIRGILERHNIPLKTRHSKDELIELYNNLVNRLNREEGDNSDSEQEYEIEGENGEDNNSESSLDNNLPENTIINFKLTLEDGNKLLIPARKDGAINVTKLCKGGGKEFSVWNRSKEAEEQIQACERFLGIPRDLIISSITTGPNENRGTWAHRRLAIIIAQWVSPTFAIQLYDWYREKDRQEDKNTLEIVQQNNNKSVSTSSPASNSNSNLNNNLGANLDNSTIINLELILEDGNKLVIPARKDGSINITKLCKAGGKEYSEWKRYKESEQQIQACERSLGIPRDLIISSITTGPNENRGTWAHRRLAIIIAQWVSPTFAVQVSGWVETLLTKGKVETKNTISYSAPSSPPTSVPPPLSLPDPAQIYIQREKTLVDSLSNNINRYRIVEACYTQPVFYVAHIGLYDNKYHYKFGKTDNIENRIADHSRDFTTFILVYLRVCDSDRVETAVKNLARSKCTLTKFSTQKNNHTEIIVTDTDYNIDTILGEIDIIVSNIPVADIRGLKHENELLKLRHALELKEANERELKAKYEKDASERELKAKYEKEISDAKHEFELKEAKYKA